MKMLMILPKPAGKNNALLICFSIKRQSITNPINKPKGIEQIKIPIITETGFDIGFENVRGIMLLINAYPTYQTGKQNIDQYQYFLKNSFSVQFLKGLPPSSAIVYQSSFNRVNLHQPNAVYPPSLL
jgi:hypothetical protein